MPIAPFNFSTDRAARASLDAQIDRAYAWQASARGERDAVGVAPPPPSLEEVTLNQTLSRDYAMLPGPGPGGSDVWGMTLTQYGSGVVELRATRSGCMNRGPAKSSIESESTNSSPSSTLTDNILRGERFASSITRSKRTCRARMLQLNADNMLTLTKRGKFKSVDELWLVFKEFSRLMKWRFGKRWAYVAVPELHADGETYHMHVALRGFFLVEQVRILWYRALGGKGDERGEHTPGNVDFPKRRRGHGFGAARARKLAGYISKYVGKGFDSCRRGRRLFAASSGLLPDRVTRWHCRFWNSTREFCTAVQRWLHDCGADVQGSAYFWSRTRLDGSLLMTGFILSTTGVINHGA